MASAGAIVIMLNILQEQNPVAFMVIGSIIIIALLGLLAYIIKLTREI